MNLYIIRHAIAADQATSEYESDSERPLTDKGRKKMRQIAKSLYNLGVEFDSILSSPYVRARETAEILAEVFKMKKNVAFTDNLTPGASHQALLSEINEKYSVDSLALVGHEPYLSSLVGLLVAGNPNVDITMKKGGVCYLTANNLQHGTPRATLEWLLTPGIMMAMSDR